MANFLYGGCKSPWLHHLYYNIFWQMEQVLDIIAFVLLGFMLVLVVFNWIHNKLSGIQ